MSNLDLVTMGWSLTMSGNSSCTQGTGLETGIRLGEIWGGEEGEEDGGADKWEEEVEEEAVGDREENGELANGMRGDREGIGVETEDKWEKE